MKAKVIETGEIVNVTPYPTWYKENGQGPDRREWDEDELEFIYSNKEETELSKVKGFLVRDKDDYTAIYAEKPHRGKTEWVNGNGSCLMTINDARLVPDIEFEDEPVEVEVTLKRLSTEG